MRYLYFLLLLPAAAYANSAAQSDQSNLLLALGIIIGGASFSWGIRKLGMPAVIGELLLGMLIGVLGHFSVGFWSQIIHNETIEFLAMLGSVLLLFEIGLETEFKAFIKTGHHGMIVALIGVILPFILGFYVVAQLLFNSHDLKLNLFLGAALAATSTGISIRMFKELGILQSVESQIVLAASVMDDVLGLVILAVVSGLAVAGVVDTWSLGKILLNVVLFFVFAAIIKWLIPRLIRLLRRDHYEDAVVLAMLLSFALILAWWAEYLGLAAIIGGFVAGVIITARDKHVLIESVQPLNYVLVPIFFVYAGMQVDLASLFSIKTLLWGSALSIAAVLGKLGCGILLPSQINRWLVGFGMLPRGEVGLIFALTGRQLGVFDSDIFAAVIMMVVVTSVITPIALQKLVKGI